MRDLAETRTRMKSVRGIHDTCRTLAVVAAAKLSKTRDRALATGEYTRRLRAMTARQLVAARHESVDPATLPALLAARPVRSVLLVVAGTDQGLCGGHNLELAAELRRTLSRFASRDVRVNAVVRGERSARLIRRLADVEVVESTAWPRAGVTDADVDRFYAEAREAFGSGEVDEVWAVYAAFLSTVASEPRTVRLLPIEVAGVADDSTRPYFYEPSRAPIVDELLGVLVRLQVEDVLLESFAAEQAARMVTMQEATERADKVTAELRVRANRLRRESITSDLAGVLAARRLRREAEHASQHL